VSFEPDSLFISLLTGLVGVALVMYGKKQQRWPHAVAGVLFMVYPYFVDGFWALVGIGAAIGAGLWLVVRAGW
jgi:short subunit fatty acids transporter